MQIGRGEIQGSPEVPELEIEKALKAVEEIKANSLGIGEILRESGNNPEKLDSEVRDFGLKFLAQLHNRLELLGDKTEKEYMPLQVFISYSHANKDLCSSLANAFKSRNVRIWVDNEKLASGTEDIIAEADEDPTMGLPGRVDFNNEIQVKGIPESSEVVVLLTKEAIANLEEIKKEIHCALGQTDPTSVAPNPHIFFVNFEDGTQKSKKDFYDGSVSNEAYSKAVSDVTLPSQELFEPEALADKILTEIRAKQQAKNKALAVQGMGPSGPIIKAQRYYSREMDLSQVQLSNPKERDPEIFNGLKNISSATESLNKAANSLTVETAQQNSRLFEEISSAKKVVLAVIDSWYKKFKPSAVYLSTGDLQMSAQLRKEFSDQGTGVISEPQEQGAELAPYGIFTITDKMLEDGFSLEIIEQIMNFLEAAAKNPDQTEIVPVYIGVGKEDFKSIRLQLSLMGIEKLADYMSIMAEQGEPPEALFEKIREFIARSEKSRKSPKMYRVNYNLPLTADVQISSHEN